MKRILLTVIGLIITGVLVLICLFFCALASKSDEYWENIKKELDKRDGRR